MLTTLEVRWFKPGLTPDEVGHWFDLGCPGELLEPPEQREDLYLYTPELEAINLKRRWGNLELKLRQAELGIRTFGSRQEAGGIFTGWEGKIERWHKWGDEGAQTQSFLSSKIIKTRPWVPVQKVRRKRLYQGICCELTQVGLSNHPWWTIAFEMAEENAQGLDIFEKAVSSVSETYHGPELLVTHSCAYPSWLWKQFSQEAEAVNWLQFLLDQRLNLGLA